MLQRPRGSTLFPYTTLFRSVGRRRDDERDGGVGHLAHNAQGVAVVAGAQRGAVGGIVHEAALGAGGADGRLRTRPTRSEEHTSELQSRQYLVCRLLLEKKKK